MMSQLTPCSPWRWSPIENDGARSLGDRIILNPRNPDISVLSRDSVTPLPIAAELPKESRVLTD